MGVFILVSGIIGYLGYSANKEIEKTVTDQFNRQQLILAGKIAHDIRNHLNFLKTNLFEFNQFWERDIKRPDVVRTEVASLFALVRDWHILAIVHLDRKGDATLALSEHSFTDGTRLGINYEDYWQWGIKPEHRGKILVGRTFRSEAGLFKGRWLMVMATPTYRPAARHGGDSGYQFEGLSLMVVDPIGVAMRYARDIRSGKTGYAWVIDH
ncbi:MAG: hypothetical protein Q8O04_09750, partial [Deltaproteobacteria bacterium]|nr:hypothetical protein [Deltaproteobacteria bacterium]